MAVQPTMQTSRAALALPATQSFNSAQTCTPWTPHNRCGAAHLYPLEWPHVMVLFSLPYVAAQPKVDDPQEKDLMFHPDSSW